MYRCAGFEERLIFFVLFMTFFWLKIRTSLKEMKTTLINHCDCIILSILSQMASATPGPSATTHGSAASQASTLTDFNQVGVADFRPQQLQPPTPPRRSSSFLPMLRRRASEPLPHSYRAHMQEPVETNPRYTYNFSQRQRRGGYLGSSVSRECCEDGNTHNCARTGAGFFPHSQNFGGYEQSTEVNLNRQSYDYGVTQSRVSAQAGPHSMRGRVFCDSQGNAHSQRLRHTSDSIHTHDGYTANIRVMAGQMYGDPPTRSSRPAQIDLKRSTHTPAERHVHSANYTHNRALSRRHHLRLSGGLWRGVRAGVNSDCSQTCWFYCMKSLTPFF